MREVTSNFNAEEVEAAVRSFWDTDDIYAQVKAQHAGDPPPGSLWTDPPHTPPAISISALHGIK